MAIRSGTCVGKCWKVSFITSRESQFFGLRWAASLSGVEQFLPSRLVWLSGEHTHWMTSVVPVGGVLRLADSNTMILAEAFCWPGVKVHICCCLFFLLGAFYSEGDPGHWFVSHLVLTLRIKVAMPGFFTIKSVFLVFNKYLLERHWEYVYVLFFIQFLSDFFSIHWWDSDLNKLLRRWLPSGDI